MKFDIYLFDLHEERVGKDHTQHIYVLILSLIHTRCNHWPVTLQSMTISFFLRLSNSLSLSLTWNEYTLSFELG